MFLVRYTYMISTGIIKLVSSFGPVRPKSGTTHTCPAAAIADQSRSARTVCEAVLLV